MNYSNRKKTKTRGKTKKIIIALIVLAVLIAAGIFSWWHWVHKPASKQVTRAGNFSGSSPSAGSNPSNSNSSSGSSGNSAAPKQPASGGNLVAGGGQDTKGQAASGTNPSQWTVSKSGDITVYQPAPNATLANGATLSGAAKVSQVNFRLVDDNVGVISQGTLSVVNGKYSGKMFFSTHSTGGQLDVFSTDSTGVELNEIQIAVKF